MKKKKIKVMALSGIVLGLLIYFFFLLHQVEAAFESPNEFIPTRIYSNVTRVAPGQARLPIERKLKSLGYKIQYRDQNLSFTLHSPNYPDHLLPTDHITPQLKDQLITLQFDGTENDASLDAIVTPSGNVNDFYLEPEFVAALTAEKSQIREVLKFDEFPKGISDAIVAAEDQHFYEHFGIDPRGFARAIWVNLKTLSFSQGGSTITQQLVKNLMERKNRNLFMKINELFLAPVIELKYSKQQIFERYLNEVFLGQVGAYEIRGFSEGAKYFFGKNVRELNMGEIALMTGLIKGPAFYSPYRHFDRAKTRQRYVLERMLETEKITEKEYRIALQHPIRLSPPPAAGNRAPYFVDYVKSEINRLLNAQFAEEEIPELGFQVYTTLDLDMNQVAQETLQQSLPGAPAQNAALQGAIAVVDHHTGEIRALIGGKNYAESNFNRILNMKRQAGSTFKPMVYASALRRIKDENGNVFTPAYPLQDAKWSWKYDSKQPVWKPSNYEREFLGWIPLKTALAKSINTTAARLSQKVGLEEVADTAKALGIETKIPLVPSISLGSVELSPLEILTAYATLANHGKSTELSVIKSILNPDGSEFYAHEPRFKQRLDSGIADMMTMLLQGVFTEGTAMATASGMNYHRPSAGKTGTTNDYRDAWFAGYTPQLTAVVWTGFDQGTSKAKLTGAGSALPIWIRMMNRILQYEPAIPFEESEQLIDMRLDKFTGQKATSDCPESQVVQEKVIAGREPTETTCEKDYPKESQVHVK
jgi:penicillin-binding protein 1B